MLKQSKKNKKDTKVDRNRTWEANHDVIENAYFKLLEQNKRVPSYHSIAKEAKLTYSTVFKHCQELSLDKWKPLFKPMTKRIIQRLAVQALKTGKSQETKLFMQLIEDYREKSDVENKIIMEDSEIVKAIETRLNLK